MKKIILVLCFMLSVTVYLISAPVTGTIKTWSSGEVLSSSDLNTTISSLRNAILNITSSQWTNNGSDIYYSGGNVGIGTSSPTSAFQISSSNGIMRYTSGNGFTPSLQLNSTSGKGGSVNVGTAGMTLIYDSTGYMAIQKDTKSNIYNTSFAASANTPVAFFESTGNVGIGTWTPSYTLHVNGTVAGTSAYVNLSDIRFKTNILPISNSLKKILDLKGVTYNWKHNEYKELNFKKDKEIGFIGQDVEKIAPEIISKDSKGIISMSYSGLIPIMVEGFKEFYNSTSASLIKQNEEINTLKEENLNLRNRLNKYEEINNENKRKIDILIKKIELMEKK